jgi:ADP-ribose pyrophosphatase YjhB (NUDIX family)
MQRHPPHPHPSTPNDAFCPKCGGKLEGRLLKRGEPERLVCAACEYVHFHDPKVATGCIVEDGGGIVLLRRAIEPGYGKWVFPGGYVDRGERVEDAAVRETLEECCLQVRLSSLLGVYSYSGRPIVVIVYAGDVIGGVLQAADEALDAGAFAPAEIPWDELAFSSTFDALAEYVERRYGVRPPKDAVRPAPF